MFINEPINYDKIKKESVIIKSGSINIPIVSINNLIELKKISGRPQDFADIAALEEVKKHEEK